MSLNIGNGNNINNIYHGSAPVSKIYLGGTQVWPIAIAGDLVTNDGAEPVLTADNGAVSVTVSSGVHAGTYTQRATDGAPLTVAMIEAAPTPISLPAVTGTTMEGDTLTIVPGLWLYAGDDPSDLSWQQKLDGVNISGGTDLQYVIQETATGKDFTVEETFGAVSVESVPLLISFVPAFAGPTALGAALHTWLDFTDTSTLFQDRARTTPIAANGDSMLSATDKSGNGHHHESGWDDDPDMVWNAANQQIDFVSADNGSYFQSIVPMNNATANMEIYIAVKSDAGGTNTWWALLSTEDDGDYFVGLGGSWNGSPAHNNSGTPIYNTNGVDNGVTGGLSAAQAKNTRTALVAGARNIDMTGWQANSLRPQLFSWSYLGNYAFDDGSVTHVVMTQALTAQQRTDLVNWMQLRLPV